MLLAALLLAALTVGAQTQIDPDDSRIKYLGAWRTDTSNDTRYTIYAGSQFRVRLSGIASLTFSNDATEPAKIKVRELGQDGGTTATINDVVILVATTATAEFEINYISHMDTVFDPDHSKYTGARLEFQGMTLSNGTTLLQATDPDGGVRLEMIGDSITQGDFTLKATNNNLAAMDGTLSYGYKLARHLDAEYRNRGYGGAGVYEMLNDGMSSNFMKDVPLEVTPEPDYVLLNMGANDTGLSSNVFENGYRQLVRAVTNKFPASYVIGLNFFSDSPNRDASLRVALSNAAPGKSAFFDAQPYLLGFADTNKHPDEASHDALATALKKHLRRDPLIDAITAALPASLVVEFDRYDIYHVESSSNLVTWVTNTASYTGRAWTNDITTIDHEFYRIKYGD